MTTPPPASPPPAPGPPPGGAGPVDHPDGTKILVLGILGLVCCSFLGPFAWVMGNRVMAEIDASPGRYSNRQTVNIGRILGIIATVLLVIGVIFGIITAVTGGFSAEVST
ncbi:hypothetical protein GCM10027055_13530 [Janibacter alkaliphilus]|uniref:DUF4190 domain-containing protein n=1 Tax=Janibacter alkaliphilus TaxID=1069963 RepID=A0A852X3L9_9MICO|nr:DUF4190 domain-containing protein [Janibacter alkaliphilus]NYG37656.1 hypothetical protein [Janibacter alkaliphilus]